MGRGLSPLQKTALRVAFTNRQREGHPRSKGADVYNREILLEHFRFAPASTHRDGSPRKGGRDPREDPGTDFFSPGEIGRSEYRCACAVAARAASRLERRGLVTRVEGAVSRWAGMNLTRKGVEVAQRITSKEDTHGNRRTKP